MMEKPTVTLITTLGLLLYQLKKNLIKSFIKELHGNNYLIR